MTASSLGRQPPGKRALGAIYTPPEIVDQVLGEAWNLVAPVPGLTICDPACGAGNFLLGARRALSAHGVSERDVQLVGADRDSRAIALARSALADAHLVHGEALFGVDWTRLAPSGFDLVVGNPPFVRLLNLRQHDPDLAHALADPSSPYRSAQGSFDLYGPMLELALALARRAVAFIVPHRLFVTDYGKALRSRLGRHVAAIVDWGDRQVFPETLAYPCILVLDARPRRTFAFERDWSQSRARAEVSTSRLAPEAWVPLLPPETSAMARLEDGAVPLFAHARSPAERLFVGLQTPSNSVYRVEILEDRGAEILVRSAAEPAPFVLEASVTRPLLMGADIRPFEVRDRRRRVVFPYRLLGADRVEPLDLPSEAPLAAGYLLRHGSRYTGGGNLGAYRYPKNLGAFEQPKLLVGGVAARGRYAYDADGRYYLVGGGDGGYSLVVREGIDPWALLALLSSAPMDFHLQRRSSMFRARCFSYGRRFLRHLPIRLEALDADLAELGRSRARASGAEASDLDREIDRAVARAYDLTERDLQAIRNLVPERAAARRRGRPRVKADDPAPEIAPRGRS